MPEAHKTLDPALEVARLGALQAYDVLDSAPDAAFDDLARLAAMVWDAPIGVVCLVDSDRQWFKAKVGLEYTQTPRSESFCAHALAQGDEVMLVPDASRDPRFADNPQVTHEPNVRFYAGAPLVTPGGLVLGSLCVFDRVPREANPVAEQALQMLARQVMTQLELRRYRMQPSAASHELAQLRNELAACRRQMYEAEQFAERFGLTDNLTGLENRRAFDRILNEEASRTERSHSPLALAIIDVDHFKSFNDEFGHAAGDMALQQLAMVLGGQARTYDHVARFGGEEFAVVLPDTSVEAATVVTERIRAAVEAFRWDRRPLTVSIGFATMATVTDSMTILERADQALYQAKHQGRNRVVHIGEGA